MNLREKSVIAEPPQRLPEHENLLMIAGNIFRGYWALACVFGAGFGCNAQLLAEVVNSI